MLFIKANFNKKINIYFLSYEVCDEIKEQKITSCNLTF